MNRDIPQPRELHEQLPGCEHRAAQSAAAVLMVRPARFGFNAQTAPSNAFQVGDTAAVDTAAVQSAALAEFDALAAGLERAGVQVVVAEDTAVPVKPDAVFPNNWLSFHGDGTLVLYPMLAPNRRLERRDEIIDQVTGGGFRISRTVDLSHREQEGRFLEGTGSLVLDRAQGVAYACLSARTHLDVLGEFAQQLDYDLVTFEAVDASAVPIYHTNVLMAVGDSFAVICSATVTDARQRIAVLEKLRCTGHEIIDISVGQMHRFAGNLLQLAPPAGSLIALSQNGWQSLQPAQQRRLESHGEVLAVDLPVIERSGGGGVRCMLAEIHLPKRGGPLMS